MKKIRIGIISLGCPRNLIDSELIIGRLAAKDYVVLDEIKDCDVAIINTCAFIEDAKREAIDVILQAVDLKNKGKIKRLIVCGCLSQRYKGILKKEIPEIDGILGIDDFKNIDKATEAVLKEEHFFSIKKPNLVYNYKDPRIIMTPPHYTYVKIAEGCNNRCSYCAIYKIRGDFRSRAMPDIIKEIKALGEKNKFSELNIIAQDTTLYGIDRYGSLKLELLLKKICGLKSVHWIRLLYTHPKNFTDALIDTIAKESSICKYIDLPIQHINDKILKLMNRRISRRQIEELITKIRKNIPDVTLRTSVIVGFPGETDKEFGELLDFISHIEFERLGAFIYSSEEDTPAYNFKYQVSDRVKDERFDRIMRLQQNIAKRLNERFKGKTLEVLIEGDDVKGKKEIERDRPYFKKCKRYIGRTQHDAPDVDGIVFVESEKRLKAGDFVNTKIIDTLEYDLVGKPVE